MLAMPDPIPVRFRDCSCPGTPHEEGDIAYLRPYLDYPSGAEIMAALIQMDDDATRFAELVGPILIKRGVTGWNVLDEEGEEVPLHPALEELPWEDAYDLAEKANDLYTERVLSPLLQRMNASTKAGQTNGSTRSRTSRKRRTPSRSSS